MPSPAPAFSGFSSPNYTMVPDQLFDELLPDLSGAELKALLYIIRRTFGFKRESDAISISQLLGGITTIDGRVLDRGVGLSKPTLLAALRSLCQKGIIITQRQQSAERGNEPTVYCLNVRGKEGERQAEQPASRPPLVKKVNQGGLVKKVDYPLVKKVNPQYTGIQETEISNIRKEEVVKKDVKIEDVYAETTLQVADREERHEQSSANAVQPHLSASGPQPVGAVVAQRLQKMEGQGGGARDAIMTRIAQFAEEFGDRATLKSSTSRAYNLFVQTSLSAEQFVNCLWEARAITRERLRAGGGRHVKNRMGYFFSVLAERLGIGGVKGAV